ncbi:hypothetical protein [Pinibacter soli]|uniref:Alpha/beta hydrolase n=1 Tax=Pinibacter soli TaxID=3044211 RepID=A0ABT6RJM6_9BACT|nr:hypothetical protein [Pinibacter soli]MDI3322052.1 hypothetical protein [Pinibacter soli]
MKQLITTLLSFVLLSTQAQYSGMTPVKFSSTLQGLVRLPASYNRLHAKKYPVIFHFCGNNETADKGGLNLLMDAGFGRQVALNRVQRTIADSIIHVIVQSPSSGAIAQPNLSNQVFDYVFAKYRCDLSTDANGKYKYVALIGLSQGASDVWDIASWDNSVTTYGISKYSTKIKKVWLVSIPVKFPSTATYQRIKGDVFHFVHGDNDKQGCCALWPAQAQNKALNANGSISSIDVIKGGGHNNSTWDRAWSVSGKDTTTNIYRLVTNGWITGKTGN